MQTSTNSGEKKGDLRIFRVGLVKIPLIQSECRSHKTNILQERVRLVFSHTVTNSRKKKDTLKFVGGHDQNHTWPNRMSRNF